MEEVYYTITIKNPDGSVSGISLHQTDPIVIKHLKKLETRYYRDQLGGSETIHKIDNDGQS